MTNTFAQYAQTSILPMFRAVLGVCTLVCVALVSEFAAAQSASNVQIDYTGALFGYFRDDGPTSGQKLTAVQNFLKNRINRSTLLLGMGDNFGPEFGAALEYDESCLEKPQSDKNSQSKAIRETNSPGRFYKDEGRIVKSAYCDNVARFLIDAGYRALVPGREDFIYSAAWLQEIARELRKGKQEGRDESNRLLLLAANLRLADGAKCRLLFADDVSGTACVDSAGDKIPVAQDWVTRLDLTLTDSRVGEAIAKMTQSDPSRRLQMMVNEMKQLLEVAPERYRKELGYFATESAYTIKGETLGVADPTKLTQDVKQIPNADCGSSEKQKDLCLLARTLIGRLENIRAKQPVFLDSSVRAASERLMLRSIADEERNIGYTFDERAGTEGRTLIIGEIGDSVMKGVSPANARIGDSNLSTLDPVATAVTLMRAVSLTAKDDNNPIRRTIVMAQMQRSEAEEFGTRLRTKLREISKNKTLAETTDPNALRVDLILSEAQPDRATPSINLDYGSAELIPVITPRRAFNVATETVEDPISTATLSDPTNNGKTTLTINSTPKWALRRGQKTALELLLTQLNVPMTSDPDRDPGRIAAVESLFEKLARYEKADVFLLPRRDLYFGTLPDEYAQYEACSFECVSESERDECKTRVALDRVFWKGDYFERVMVSGKDLKNILKTAQQKAQSERNLDPQDITGQWLYTFGVVTNEPDQLTRIEMSSERFSLPQSEACLGELSAAQEEKPYCINGATISDDASYWIATSDSLAHDTTDYSQFTTLPPGYHQPSKDLFFTRELRNALAREPKIDLHDNLAVLSKFHQYENLFHLDLAKWIAGFSIRHPVGGNAAAAKFQGVAESRASQSTQQELDLETTTRVYRDVGWKFPFSIGNQTILEYDRSVQGNLSQKPITANYSLNNFSTGLFFQKRIPYFGDAPTTNGNWANRELPRTLIIMSPIRYQQQLVGSFLYFSHSDGKGQQTVSLPRAYGYSSRIGIRHEIGGGSWWKADRESYFEAGLQLAAQYNVLRSMTLFTGAASFSCSADSTETIPQCFGNNKQFPIDATTTPVNPITGSKEVSLQLLHATGWYWNVHFQKGVLKNTGQYGVNLSLDSAGDFFNSRRPGASLSTQTRYAFPITTSVNFPVLRNFSLSPTYTAFFYENQVGGQAITINTFSIAAKWFYDRDSRVPLLKQLLFKGPASLDQTKSAKMK